MDQAQWSSLFAVSRHIMGQRLWQQHTQEVTCHITKSSITAFQQLFEGAIFHCEDKQASSLWIYCPFLYYQAIENTLWIHLSSNRSNKIHPQLSTPLSHS